MAFRTSACSAHAAQQGAAAGKRSAGRLGATPPRARFARRSAQPSGGGAGWATVSGQRRSQLSARSVRQRSQVLPPSGVEESCWLGRRRPAARVLGAASLSSRSRVSPAPSAGPLRGVKRLGAPTRGVFAGPPARSAVCVVSGSGPQWCERFPPHGSSSKAARLQSFLAHRRLGLLNREQRAGRLAA
jgi:hypothetical protein